MSCSLDKGDRAEGEKKISWFVGEAWLWTMVSLGNKGNIFEPIQGGPTRILFSVADSLPDHFCAQRMVFKHGRSVNRHVEHRGVVIDVLQCRNRLLSKAGFTKWFPFAGHSVLYIRVTSDLIHFENIDHPGLAKHTKGLQWQEK